MTPDEHTIRAPAVGAVTLEPCRFRRVDPHGPPGGCLRCGFVQAFLGLREDRLCQVDEATCRACLACLHPAEQMNPVKASLVHRAAAAIEHSGGAPGCSSERASRIRRGIIDQLAVVSAGRPDVVFPPNRRPSPEQAGGLVRSAELRRRSQSEPGNASESEAGNERPAARTWMVGMLTAPRTESTLGRSLTSFCEAGFGEIHLFAEPEAEVCEHAALRCVTRAEHRLGNLGNFLMGLAELYQRCGDADCYAIFQDDVIAAAGLKAWCDRELWPDGHGLVSLFTPRIHAAETAGWHVRRPGFYRVHGGQALVFRRDVLEEFLSDPHVACQMHLKRHGDDAIVSGWATRRRFGIAYHTPSPTQHIGCCSSINPIGPDPLNIADFVSDVRQIPGWTRPPRRRARIGLIGWNVNTGLGEINRDLVRHLDVDRWMIPPCHYRPTRPEPDCPARTVRVGWTLPREEQLRLLDGLDWLVFAEHPYVSGIPEAARAVGVRLACIPMWETLNPQYEWLQFVDLMICPTRHTYRHLGDWRDRYSLGFDLIEVAWPIDATRFPFLQRRRCQSFLYVNGLGGGRAPRSDGSVTSYGRKGLETVLAAARRASRHRFDIVSMVPVREPLPPNVTLHPAPASNANLYLLGDVCVQPSTWEGIGLQLLECQAAGLPLVTTDAPPMNEYDPLAVIPVERREVVFINGSPVPSHVPSADGLVEILDRIAGTDITDASRRARDLIEQTHNWDQVSAVLERHLTA